MGFLDNLLKKETRKIISGVVDSVVDNVVGNVKNAIKGDDSTAEAKSSPYVSVKMGVGSFHLLMHLPNRKTYIAERFKAVMPS